MFLDKWFLTLDQFFCVYIYLFGYDIDNDDDTLSSSLFA